MIYTADRHNMKVYSQAKHKQPTNHIHKCMAHVVLSIMQLTWCYIWEQDEYMEIYNEFISQLHIYSKAVRILAKAYLPISLITPLK